MADAPSRTRVSAGILLFRCTADSIEVLLGHPGGPYFEAKDAGAWSIPKGQAGNGEQLLAVAKREFGEETGHVVGSNARVIELGSVRQRGGKTVYAWAVEGDMDPNDAWSNTFPMEWPPRSGIFIEVPELDRVAWFTPDAARIAMNPAQVALIDALLQALDR
ncbi:MAG TPA: NUDIX domain-containing protein [Anaerolineae bacterium]|jgi:predicted NUDIX family NTP pyrophosphohydrolase|nr:NUDIX domain-containing protein [Anaerolineae bacterium]